MIYKEDALFWKKSILESLDHIDHYHSPLLVPIVENSRLHTNIVKYTDLYKFAEDSNFSLHQALSSIKASHNLNNVSVSIDEAYIYDNPYILNSFSSNVVINPISENTEAYLLCETCMNTYLNTGDDRFIDYFLFCEEGEFFKLLEELNLSPERKAIQKLQNRNTINQSIINHTNDYYMKRPEELKSSTAQSMTTYISRYYDNIEKNNAAIKELEKKAQAKEHDEMMKATGGQWGDGGYEVGTPKPKEPDEAEQWANLGKNKQTSTTTPNQQSAQTQQQTSTTTPNQQSAQTQQANPNGQPSWWSQKWASFTKFLNNLGNSNNVKGEQNSQWFSNIVDKIKGFFSSNPATAQQEAFLIEATRLRKTAFSFGAGRTKSTTNIPQPATGYGPPNNSAISKSSNIQQQPMNEVYRPRRRYRTQYLH